MNDNLLKETIVLLSADIYRYIYERTGGWGDAVAEILSLAEEFEKELKWQINDERDYILELEKFERRVLDSFDCR